MTRRPPIYFPFETGNVYSIVDADSGEFVTFEFLGCSDTSIICNFSLDEECSHDSID